MNHSTASLLAINPRLKFEHDLRGWTSVTITATNRNAAEYVDTVRHALKHGEMVQHPRDATEAAALEAAFPEVAEMFADCAVTW